MAKHRAQTCDCTKDETFPTNELGTGLNERLAPFLAEGENAHYWNTHCYVCLACWVRMTPEEIDASCKNCWEDGEE